MKTTLINRSAAAGAMIALALTLTACGGADEVPATPQTVTKATTPADTAGTETPATEKPEKPVEKPAPAPADDPEALKAEWEKDTRWGFSLDEVFIPAPVKEQFKEEQVHAAVLSAAQTLAEGGYQNVQLLMARDISEEDNTALKTLSVLAMEDHYGAGLYNDLLAEARGEKDGEMMDVLIPTVERSGKIAALDGVDYVLNDGTALVCAMPTIPNVSMSVESTLLVTADVHCAGETAKGKFLVERQVNAEMIERGAGWAINSASYTTTRVGLEG